MRLNFSRSRVLTAVALTAGLTLASAAPVLAAPTDKASYLRYYHLKRDLYITKANVDIWGKTHTDAKKIPASLAHHSGVYRGSVRITGTLRNYTVTAYNTRDGIKRDIKIINGSTSHASAGIIPNH